jgi:hypothetical protein
MWYRVGGPLLLILDIYVIYLIVNSSAESNKKLLWIIAVVLLPLLGPILYLLLEQGKSAT